MFPWEFDARPGRFRNGEERKIHAQQMHRFQRSREKNYLKSGHPKWYPQYLQTEHWLKFKEKYKASGRPRYCVVCKERRYELHHRTYERIGKEELDDIVTLCRRHHSRAHKREKEGVPLWDAHLE